MEFEASIRSDSFVKRDVELLSASDINDHIQKSYNYGFLLETFMILNSIIELYLICIYIIKYGKKYGNCNSKKVDKIFDKYYPYSKKIKKCWEERFISKDLYEELIAYNKERNVFTHNILEYWEYNKNDFEEQYRRGMKIKTEMEKVIIIKFISNRQVKKSS